MFRPPGLARQAIGILASSRELMNEAQPMRMANGGDVNIIETYLDQARRMAEAQGLRPGSMLYNQVVGTLYNQLSSTKPSVSQLFPPRAPEPQPVDVSTPMTRQAFPGRGVGSFRGLRSPDVDSAPLGAPEPEPAESKADMLSRVSSIISPPTGVGPDSIRALEREREREKPRRMTSVERREAKRPGGDPTRVQDPFYTIATAGRSPEGKELTTARAEQRRGSTVPEEVEAQKAQAEEVTARLKEQQEAVERKAAAQAGDAPAVSTVDAPAVPDTTTKPFVVDITPKEQEVIAPEYQKFLQMVISGGGNMQEADKNFYLMMFGLTTAAGESDNPLLNITKAARDTLLAYATEKRDIEKSNFVRRLEASKALADIKLAEAQVNKPGSLEKNFALVREKLPNLPVEEQLIIAGGGKQTPPDKDQVFMDLASDVQKITKQIRDLGDAKVDEKLAAQARDKITRFMAIGRDRFSQDTRDFDTEILPTFGITPEILAGIEILR